MLRSWPARVAEALVSAWLLVSIPSSSNSFTVEASHLTPPVIPLTVRNPYFSTWLGNARDVPWKKWPMFYTGEEIGFSFMASVPEIGSVYPLLGRPQDSLLPVTEKSGYNISYPEYLGAQWDASTTNLSYIISHGAQSVNITLSFLSPITPTSTARQSIPASYVTVLVKGDLNIDIYTDVNGQWISGDRGSRIVWELDQSVSSSSNADAAKTKPLKTWKIRRENEAAFTEIRDRSEWGTLAFTAPEDVRHESGTSALLRQRFSRTSTLQNDNDNKFRSIMDEEPVFAFAKSFALNSSSIASVHGDSVTFTLTHIQDPVVQFASARGLTQMKPLWKSWWPQVNDLLSYHYYDYPKASALAANYSTQLAIDAYKSGADEYVDILALSARQVLGATSFSGTPDNPILFLKEISSNGNFQTIDVIFPAFPFFLYSNPRWLAYLLEPLIEHMLSGQYPNTYAMHDLGTHFPNATGHADGRDEYMPVEECGNILMMGLAIVNSLKYETDAAAGSIWATEGSDALDDGPNANPFNINSLETRAGIDMLDDKWGGSAKGVKQARKWVEKSYKLWRQWTGYLVDFSLEPENQLSTDDFAGWLALQTNLALKGIIGINAMSELSAIVGNTDDQKYFKNISDTYVAKWEEYGMSRDGQFAKLAYNWYGSWTTLYNLFGDALLCFHLEGTDLAPPSEEDFNLYGDQKPIKDPKNGKDKIGFVPRHIYTLQSAQYANVRQHYGLPLDNRHLYTKTDWEFFAMAVSSPSTRSTILKSVALWLNETVTDKPFTDLHDTEGKGGFPGITFYARPVVGGHFAFLALEKACGGKAIEGLKFLEEGTKDAVEAEADYEMGTGGGEL